MPKTSSLPRRGCVKRHSPMGISKPQGNNKNSEAAKKKNAQQLARSVQTAPKTKTPAKNEMGDYEVIDPRMPRKVLDLARRQQEEIDGLEDDDRTGKSMFTARNPSASAEEDIVRDTTIGSDSDGEELDDEAQEEYTDNYAEFADQYAIDPHDQELIDRFMAPEPRKQALLSDIIMQKMLEHEQQLAEEQLQESESKHDRPALDANGDPIHPKPSFSDKIMDVYTKVGFILSRYRSGKVPKMFKVIPSLADWEDVLLVTSPESWSPQATYQATRIFVSNLKDKQVQRFFSVFLLPKVHDDIQANKKLNYHYYMALKKALYKPGAFFKGILLPMCESGSCTLQEAVIVGSVIAKVSIPVLHSAAVLLKLAEMDYSGPNSLFIRIFLDKKYALPFKVIDALVFHFLRFRSDPRELPLLWHQSLLVFAQRYKQDIAPDQRDALLDLCKDKFHPMVTEEIRRELTSVDTTAMVVMD